ncbi:MAG: N-acetylmuramoyl-L-alanine amidase [Deltaproteobacteria bacterium]|nr:N-acetylmuramoyl-L-alanine amidase [Deltaproteobacteria bacterium]
MCYDRGVRLLPCLVLVIACSQKRPEEPARGSAPPAPVVVAVAADAAAPVEPPVDAAMAVVSAPAIVDAPMVWNAEREKLTLAYRTRHSDADAKDVAIEPKVIVLHYTAGATAKSTRTYFDNIRIEAERAELAAAGAVNVSSHYVIDRDGTIYRLQPETRFARHCIGLNHISIGIENAGDGDLGARSKHPLTEAQVAANVALVRYLASAYGITHLMGHHEVGKLVKHPYYREREPKYFADKPDPGPAFMKRVREGVADLGLAQP